jgi:transcription elongation GreA/GreB family factor
MPVDPVAIDPFLDKGAVVRALAAAARERCAAVERVAALARDEASSEESKSEGKYDTRATEASYLARGQAERVDDLRRARSWFEAASASPSPCVDLGALVELRMRGRDDLVYVAPFAAVPVDLGGRTIRVLAAQSPLARALAGAVAGDEVEVEGPQGVVEATVLRVG